MAKNAIYEILGKHLVSGKLKPGEEIGIRPDQLMTQDGTGTMVFLNLDKIGKVNLRGRHAICYVDHNTLGVGSENADDHQFLQAACQKYKVHYSKPGNGIGHQIHLERFAQPGGLLLGADSHVTTLGGLGMLAIGTGGLELVLAFTGAPHYLICPEVYRVVLTGHLKPWSSAKDVILYIIDMLASRPMAGVALEYDGPGVAGLSIPQRATIANMGAELGVTTSLFPTDEVTKTWLSAQGRASSYRKVASSAKGQYADEIQVDLGKIVPMVALPHTPLVVSSVSDVKNIKVQQVAVGSCTNGSFEDLAKVAAVLKGNRVHPEVDMVVAPATRQAMKTLVNRSLLKVLLEAGCRIAEPACGFCIGHGQTPGSGWVSVRTNNRNYRGRCGTMNASVYLVSPETAAATAIMGKLTDPRTLNHSAPRVRQPSKFPVDDSMIVSPPRTTKRTMELPRGPNIVAPPEGEPLAASLSCDVVVKLGDRISTDDILPAGRWLKYRSNVVRYAEHTFSGISPGFAQRAKENLQHDLFNIVVAGSGYGQGSSREHAAMCPRILGVRVILAKSFERIHKTNLINHGIVPLEFLDPRVYEEISPDDYLELPWIARELRRSKTVTIRNPDKGLEFKTTHTLTRRQIDILLAGGLLRYAANRNK